MVGLQKEGPYLKIRTWIAGLGVVIALLLAGYPTLISYGRDSNRLAAIESKAEKHELQIETLRADLYLIKSQLAVQTEILKRIERSGHNER